MVSEPTSPDEHVPDAVLDELAQAFSSADTPVSAPRPPTPAPAPAPTSASAPAPARATIVISAPELPDTMYLDEAIAPAERLDPREVAAAERLGLADGAAGFPEAPAIVIGNELDSSGAFDAVALPKRSMDPRVRERRAAVRKERSRRRLIWVGAIAGVIVVVVGALALLSSSLFSVKKIAVQGATYSAARYGAQLDGVLTSMRGQAVLTLDTRAAERDLEKIPWIERAYVTTHFPNSVFVDVRERRPLATFAGSDGRYRVIDREGRVLDVIESRPVDYMLLTGPGPDTDPGDMAGEPFAIAAQLVAALPAEIRTVTESASVDASTGDLGLHLTPNVDVHLGGIDRIDAKLARLLQRVREGLDGVTRIDVSSDGISVTGG